MRVLIRLLTFFVFLAFPAAVMAQQGEPVRPAPIQALADGGAQVRYLGLSQGMNGWAALKNGVVQYFYATPDGEAIVVGLLFDKAGKLVTTDQVRTLREREGALLDPLAGVPDVGAQAVPKETDNPFQAKSASERLYDEVEQANWVRLGSETAPFIYVFVDPQCPHCHQFMDDLRKAYIENGRLQVRLIPVGLRPETVSQAAVLLAAQSPEAVWFRHMDGDESALPVNTTVNKEGVARNLAIMGNWKFDVTPITVYKARDGKVKILRGRARDVDVILKDIQ